MENNREIAQKRRIGDYNNGNVVYEILFAALFFFIVIKLSLDKVLLRAYNALKYRKGDGSYASHRENRQHDDGYDDAHGYHGHDDVCAKS